MDYYFYNTDAGSVFDPSRTRFQILIDRQFAAIGGAPIGEKFRQLKINDVLLMYENKVGVVAVGIVQESWDGNKFTNPWYYTSEEMPKLTGGAFEYRIKVEWVRVPIDKPITLKYLRQLFGSKGFTPRGTIKKIIKYRIEIEEMLAGLISSYTPTTLALDLEGPLPSRIETTIYRILRDTAMALKVKHLHNYKCQICGHTILLPGGGSYAEAHHIMPLGKKHNGPDVIGNILCVCPNHHAELDYGVSKITISALTCSKGHVVDSQYINYHNLFIYKFKNK
jgi:hypothetical protein